MLKPLRDFGAKAPFLCPKFTRPGEKIPLWQLWTIFVVMCFWLLFSGTLLAKELDLHQYRPGMILEPDLEFFAPQGTLADYDQMQLYAQWQPISQYRSLAMGQGLWLRFELYKPQDMPQDWLLVLPQAQLNFADFYVENIQAKLIKVQESGNNRPFRLRQLPHRYPTLSLSRHLGGLMGEHLRIYIYLHNYTAKLPSHVQLLAYEDWVTQQLKRDFQLGLVQGFLLMILLYHLLIFALLHEKYVLSFVAFGLGVSGYSFFVQGLGLAYVEGFEFWMAQGYLLFVPFMFMGLLSFIPQFYALHLAGLLRWIYRALMLLAMVSLMLVLLALIGTYPSVLVYGVWLNYAICLGGAVFLGLLVWRYWKRIAQDKTAVLMLLASVLLIFFAWITLMDNGQWGQSQDQHLQDVAMLWLIVLGELLVALAFYRRMGEIKSDYRLQQVIIQESSKRLTLGQLMGNVSHQWIAPLNQLAAMVMKHQANLALHRPLNEEAIKVDLDKMEQMITFMSRTLRDLTQFYKVDAQAQHVDLLKVIDLAVNLVHERMVQAGVTLQLPEQSVFIHTHANALANVLLSLMSNAIKIFLERRINSPQLRITLKEEEREVILSLSDNAGGIRLPLDEIFLPHISSGEGSGTGLYLAKHLVENTLHGSISVQNTKDGARFILCIPR